MIPKTASDVPSFIDSQTARLHTQRSHSTIAQPEEEASESETDRSKILSAEYDPVVWYEGATPDLWLLARRQWRSEMRRVNQAEWGRRDGGSATNVRIRGRVGGLLVGG